MPLSSRDYNAIQSLKRDNVKKTLVGLKRFTKASKWVGGRNRYVIDTKKKIATETKTGGLKKPRQMSQYIAASCLLHCTDGWSYLGKAMSSLLRGDPHRARHLAYYAELRAAMALLATTGVGVFDKHHFVVDAPNSVAALKGQSPTHQFVWDCLEYWCTQAWSGDLFASIVRPNGRKLEDWLAPVGGGSVAAPQAKEWFLQWGMDLQLPTKDREARNESSYRPDGMPDTWTLDPPATLRFARDIWRALEPSHPSRFDTVDRHILRLALESIFKGQQGISAPDDPARFRQFASRLVKNQGLSEDTAEQWLQFLCRKIAPDNLSIFEFSKITPGARENSHAAIVARATLLLRVASGSTADLIQDAGFTSDAIAFWWERMGLSRGLWEGAKNADGLLDLWADIESLLHDLDIFQERHAPAAQTFFRVASELGQALVGLGSCERVAVWSLTPS
jgi:hypothetical protein